MNIKPILIITGEPYSIFSEIFFRTLRKNKFKKKIIIIGSLKLLKKQNKFLGFKDIFNEVSSNFKISDLKKNAINVINIELKTTKAFTKISTKSKDFIKMCFEIALILLLKKKVSGVINGPVSKVNFLPKNILGITEYFAKLTNINNYAMLIYNKNLSVSPMTTHIPIKDVPKSLKKKNIIKQVLLIKKFYKTYFKKDAKIAITGLNPHCESRSKYNEESKIIKPAINYLKKVCNYIDGPLSADSIFMKKNIKKYDVIIGMYHDQVLTPLKTLYNFNAINITLGLPFIRISPDHGTNEIMAGKNLSNPESLYHSINFLDKR